MRARVTKAAAVGGLALVAASLLTAMTGAPADAAAPTTTPIATDPMGSARWGDISASLSRRTLSASGAWVANQDAGSLYTLTAGHGIQTAWSRGMTGKGVTVAVVDTGVAPVPGLDGDQWKLVDGPDLSFEGQAEVNRYVDGFGHGTHLAGIIAGRDKGWDAARPNPRVFAGVAPDAQILNVKVGSSDGGADVSQVIAALDWLVQHKRDAGMNVRVIALAYGTASPQAWQVDPLAHAVESAWRAGIVVVSAAGNDGTAAGRLVMPAADPHVLAVGAVDTLGTEARTDDVVAPFSSAGSTARRPDVVAPGRSVVSLRVPGGYADTMSPEGRVTGDASGRFFRGSGTSQATAFVAGEVALLLQKRPALTPDQVKALLVSTARPLKKAAPAMGAGVPDVLAASTAALPKAAAAKPFSTGTGSLELARGGDHVVDPVTGTTLTGEVDAVGGAWKPAAWAAASTKRTAWQKGVWNGRVWSGDRFVADRWQSAPWVGVSWTGAAWDSTARQDAWAARSWRADSWEARSWRADSWLARSWRSLL
jgi:serine protease AprX